MVSCCVIADSAVGHSKVPWIEASVEDAAACVLGEISMIAADRAVNYR
jgi:hypothetical protein